MPAKPTRWIAAAGLSVALAVAVHAQSLTACLPGECGQCHLPGVWMRPASSGDAPPARCRFCGATFSQAEIRQIEAKPTPWAALFREFAGLTDAGPVHAGSQFPGPRVD